MLLSIMHKVYTCYACGVSFNLARCHAAAAIRWLAAWWSETVSVRDVLCFKVYAFLKARVCHLIRHMMRHKRCTAVHVKRLHTHYMDRLSLSEAGQH